MTADDWDFWIPRWIATKAPRTQCVYRPVVNAFLECIASKPISSVTVVDVEDYLLSLTGCAKRTIERYRATVCSLLTYIHDRDSGVMPINIGALVKRVKIRENVAERILTEEQVMAIIAAERVPWKHALLMVLYGTGIRPEELVKIQRKHVTERPEDDEFRIIIHGKGDKMRTVKIFKSAAAALESILPADTEAFLFPGKRGQRMHSVYASFLVTAAGKRAGFRVSAMSLRHAHASHALERNAPIHLVRDTLGHASIATTGKYLHANPKDSSGRYLNL